MKIKKVIRIATAMVFATMMLVSCAPAAPTDTTEPDSSSEEVLPSENATTPDSVSESPIATEKSANEQIWEIMAENSLGLTGVPLAEIADRADVAKAIPQPQRGNLKIGLTLYSLGSDFFTSMLEAMQSKSDGYGYTLNVQNANMNITTQNTQIDMFITQKMDAIIVNAINIESVSPSIKKAVDAGIPVFTTTNMSSGPQVNLVTNVITNSFEAGWQAGIYTANALYKKGEVLKIAFQIIQMGSADSEGRSCGFLSGYYYQARSMDGDPYATQWDAILDGYNSWQKLKNEAKYDDSAKGLNMLAIGQAPTADAAGGQKGSADFITAHPDLNIIFSENDSMFQGIVVNLKQHDLTPGEDVYLAAAADATKTGMESVMDGSLLCVGNNSPLNNAVIIELIHKIFEEDYTDANNLPANTLTPCILVTKLNVDQYYNPNSPVANSTTFEVQTVQQANAAGAASDNPLPIPELP